MVGFMKKEIFSSAPYHKRSLGNLARVSEFFLYAGLFHVKSNEDQTHDHKFRRLVLFH